MKIKDLIETPIIRMKLTELLNAPYNVSIENTKNGVKYKFTQNKSKFYVLFTPLKDNEYLVSFKKVGLDNRRLPFYVGKNNQAFKIFSTLKEIITNFINNNKPKKIIWRAKDKRAELYKKFNHKDYEFKDFGNNQYGLIKLNESAKEDIKFQKRALKSTMSIVKGLDNFVTNNENIIKNRIKQLEGISEPIDVGEIGNWKGIVIYPEEMNLSKYDYPLNETNIWIGRIRSGINGFMTKTTEGEWLIGLPIIKRPSSEELGTKIKVRQEEMKEMGIELPRIIETKYEILAEVYIEQIKEKIKNPKLQSTIFHELTHIYDEIRTKNKERYGTVNLSRSEYFNDPKEFNAFYNQISAKIHFIVQVIQQNPQRGLTYAEKIGFDIESFKNTLDNIIEKEIVNEELFIEFISLLRKKRYRRFYKRLYTLWSHVSEFIKQTKRRFG